MAESTDQHAVKQRRIHPLLKFFVAFHVIAITSWSLPNAPPQYIPQPRWEAQNGKLVMVKEEPRVPLGIRTNGALAIARSTAEYLANEPLVLNQLYVKSSPVRFYLMSTGFWQYWDMFSPNPASVDIYSTATVYYKDGSSKAYTYPRMYELNLGIKYLKERYRKFFERAGDANNRYLWPIFAQQIAQRNWSDPTNPPVKVELHKHSLVIAAPGEPQAKEYRDELYYTHVVDVDELSAPGDKP